MDNMNEPMDEIQASLLVSIESKRDLINHTAKYIMTESNEDNNVNILIAMARSFYANGYSDAMSMILEKTN